MTPRALLHNIAVCNALLGTAALLVPGSDRKEWRDEWKAELWHLLDQRGLPHRLHECEEATAFCCGAFADALWMRRNHTAHHLRASTAARRPLLLLALGVAAALLLCLALSGPRDALSPLPYQRDSNLLAVTRGGYAGMQTPTIAVDDYRAWQTTAHSLFSDIAFYQPATARVRIAQHPAATLTIARASQNLFDLLQLASISIASRFRP